MTDWERDGVDNGWVMPPSSWLQRLPVVRHMRALVGLYAVHRWYTAGPGIMGIRTGYDEWVLYGIWHGYGNSQPA